MSHIETENIIDVSDLTDRFKELRDERASLVEDVENAEEAVSDAETDLTFASHGDGDVGGLLAVALSDAQADLKTAQEALSAFDESDDAEELKELETLLKELEGYGGDHQFEGDWYPGTLIRDSYFSEYAEQLAGDLHGSKVEQAEWPFNCIDWEKAAQQLLIDYAEVEIDGIEYHYR